MRIKTEKLNSRKTTWLLVGAGAAMVAGRLVERGLEKGWRAARHEDPPDQLKRGASWPAATVAADIAVHARAAGQLSPRFN